MRGPTRRSILALLTVIPLLAACGTAAPSHAPSLGLTDTAQPSPAPSLPSSAATFAAPSGSSPTPSVLTLSGTWVHPKAGERLAAYTVTLSAKPSGSGPGVTTFTEVAFSAAWAGAPMRTVCAATEPGTGAVWSCRASLLALGVPPGKVTFSFDVHGGGVPAAQSPDGFRTVTYAVPPPRPTNAGLAQISPPAFENGENTGTYRVNWTAPAGYADQFLIYYTEECPRPSTAQNAGKPCFVAGTPVDVSRLELLAKTDGGARTARVLIPESQCEGIYGSILLRARNESGNSPFAVVFAAPVSPTDTDGTEMIC